MDNHDRLLAVFLAGDLDSTGARRWDEHLLECEACWRAVQEDRAGRRAAQVLRQPPPPGLADRVAFAVEVAATPGTAAPGRSGQIGPARPERRGRHVSWRLAGTGMLAAAAAVALLVA